MQQFRNKLDGFTTRFEYELRNKIDQIGLTDFENKMNNKFYIDLREKLDKNDLKKNNNMINRKIDNLESKISKTLLKRWTTLKRKLLNKNLESPHYRKN